MAERRRAARRSARGVFPRTTLFSQSEVAAIAVMAERPGMFLDADTVILPGFDPSHYQAAWLTMYGETSVEGGADRRQFLPCEPA